MMFADGGKAGPFGMSRMLGSGTECTGMRVETSQVLARKTGVVIEISRFFSYIVSL
jgi:hypothetical protein